MTISTPIQDELKSLYGSFLKVQAGIQRRILSPLNMAVSDVIYTTALKALVDTRGGIDDGKFKVVSAPTGSSKTTSAIAFAAAGHAAMDDFTCCFVVEEIRAAKEIYRQLTDYIQDGSVAIWTSQNDAKKLSEDYTGDIPRFSIDQMRETRIVVFTHKKWVGEMARGVDEGVRLYKGVPRDVLFVDEQPSVIDIIEQTPGDIKVNAQEAISKFDSEHPWVPMLKTVVERMDGPFDSRGNEWSAYELIDCLEAFHFTEEKAAAIWREHYGTSPSNEYRQAFQFLQAASMGYCFLNRKSPKGFIAYLPQFKAAPNQVLLDATADISEVSLLMGGQLADGLPKVDYSNLRINHIAQPRKFSNINRVTDSRATSLEYADWIKRVVMENSSEGEQVLVVMHKKMIERHALFPVATSALDLEVFPGRKTNVIWWGSGIGSNTYKDATRVFMFSEYYVPRKTILATTLGATGTPANEAPLDKLSKHLSGDCLDVQEGDVLRWVKQLASRGNVRNINEDGTCGEMHLFLSMDFGRLIRNLDRLFPGAKAPTKLSKPRKVPKGVPIPAIVDVADEDGEQEDTKGRHGLISLLATTDRTEISTKEIEEITGIKSCDISRELAVPTVAAVAATYGWSTTSAKAIGKSGRSNWLVRTTK